MRLAFRKSKGKDNQPVIEAPPHFNLGRRGEALAVEYLQQSGYRIWRETSRFRSEEICETPS